MEVLLAVDLLLGLVQKLQHLPDDGLQRTAQVFPAVRLSKRRHMYEGRATMAQVQRRVVSEITEVPDREECAASHKRRARCIKRRTLLCCLKQHYVCFRP